MTLIHRLLAVCCCSLALAGCDKLPFVSNSSESSPAPAPPQPPRVMVKRVPCKIKMGPLAAALEVDLSEIKNLVLDGKQLYHEIINGEPGPSPPEKGHPVIMVVNKKDSKVTYFQLTPNIKEVRLKGQDAKEVLLVVKNQEPLQVEMWIDSPKDVEIDVEFKDSASPQPK